MSDNKTKYKDFEELRWIRVFTPTHIPKYLVEQIRHRDFSIEDFFKYQESLCIKMTPDGPSLNPMNHLYVLANDENLTKGFVWFIIDALSKAICIQSYSIDKEYWNNGKAVSKLSVFIKDFLKKSKLEKVYWITNYPKHSEKHGFKRSRSVLMEYSEETDGQDVNGRSSI